MSSKRSSHTDHGFLTFHARASRGKTHASAPHLVPPRLAYSGEQFRTFPRADLSEGSSVQRLDSPFSTMSIYRRIIRTSATGSFMP